MPLTEIPRPLVERPGPDNILLALEHCSSVPALSDSLVLTTVQSVTCTVCTSVQSPVTCVVSSHLKSFQVFSFFLTPHYFNWSSEAPGQDNNQVPAKHWRKELGKLSLRKICSIKKIIKWPLQPSSPPPM